MAEQQFQQLADNDEINLLDYWRVTWKRRWLIGVLTCVSVLAAMILGLLSPKVYESKVTIIMPKEGGGAGLLSSLGASGLVQQIGGISIPSLTPNRDLFISVLKSRLMAKYVVQKFNLQERNKAKTLDEAIDSAKNIPQITSTKEGLIEIKVEDTDPKTAADIANFYPGELDRLVTQFATTAASGQRRFVSEQLAKAEKELQGAEETLKLFQEKNRAYLIGDMVNSMRLPGTKVPQVGLELARLSRDLKLQETIHTFLTQQLEQTKLNEAQDLPVVQVLDKAVPALNKSKPRIKFNMAIAGIVSIFFGTFLAFLVEYIQRQRQQMANSK